MKYKGENIILGYLDWFDAYCPVCKKDTPHGRDDPCREDEEAIVWCLVCQTTTKDEEYKRVET